MRALSMRRSQFRDGIIQRNTEARFERLWQMRRVR